METNEIWKDIQEYEGRYQVSNFGRVKSLNYLGKTGKEKILTPNKNKRGYFRVDLCKNGTIKHNLVHRLVATAFIPNPDNLPVINHKDENPSNNRVDNLEWCTVKYNTNYGTGLKRARETRIKNGTYTGLTEKEYSKKYRDEHKEEIKERGKKYYQKHSKEIYQRHKDYLSKYYIEHKEHLKEYKKKYHQEHKNKQGD